MKVALKEFNEICGKIMATYHDAALKMGISDSERDILYIMASYGNGCNQSAFYKESGLTRSTVNSAIRKMEKAELLYLEAGEGRNTKVFLTQKGEDYMRNTVGKLIAVENEIFEGWSHEEKKTFIDFNKRYASELAEKIKEL